MKRMRYWLASKKLLMAQMHDLQRQWQEMRDERDKWESSCYAYYDKAAGLLAQLHRVARERDRERKKRIDAEVAHLDSYLDRPSEEEIATIENYKLDNILAELENEDERDAN